MELPIQGWWPERAEDFPRGGENPISTHHTQMNYRKLRHGPVGQGERKKGRAGQEYVCFTHNGVDYTNFISRSPFTLPILCVMGESKII